MKDPNYPWREHFPVLSDDLKRWEAEKTGEGLLFHALQKNLINREKYFDWAGDRYQMPFLKSAFFEYALIGEAQWKRVKDLREWSREVLPVWEWENMVYVGCMEPPEDRKNWTFPHRLVLVTDMALKMQWKAVRRFSDLRPKAEGKTARPAETAEKKPPPLTSLSAVGLPEEPAPAAPAVDPAGEPVRETSPSAEKPDTPQRDNIIPLNFKQPADEKPAEDFTENALSEKTGIIRLEREDGFSDLQEKLQKSFAGILLLKNRDSLLYPEKWAGRIQIKDTSKPLISLKTISIFSILLKGFDYHGFVVENENNIKLFQDLNWPVLPKHVTAVPFAGPDQKLNRVFLGVAVKSLSHKKLPDIKSAVLPFFEEIAQKQAA